MHKALMNQISQKVTHLNKCFSDTGLLSSRVNTIECVGCSLHAPLMIMNKQGSMHLGSNYLLLCSLVIGPSLKTR